MSKAGSAIHPRYQKNVNYGENGGMAGRLCSAYLKLMNEIKKIKLVRCHTGRCVLGYTFLRAAHFLPSNTCNRLFVVIVYNLWEIGLLVI